MPLFAKQRPLEARQVVCTNCAERSEASRRAMSVFCPHCHKRVILENYKIRSYHGVKEFSTCGEIVVEPGGHVVARIKASSLTIKGKVQGNVNVRGQVAVRKKGSLQGDVEAPSLLVEKGGKFTGFVRIEPLPNCPD